MLTAAAAYSRCSLVSNCYKLQASANMFCTAWGRWLHTGRLHQLLQGWQQTVPPQCSCHCGCTPGRVLLPVEWLDKTAWIFGPRRSGKPSKATTRPLLSSHTATWCTRDDRRCAFFLHHSLPTTMTCCCRLLCVLQCGSGVVVGVTGWVPLDCSSCAAVSYHAAWTPLSPQLLTLFTHCYLAAVMIADRTGQQQPTHGVVPVFLQIPWVFMGTACSMPTLSTACCLVVLQWLPSLSRQHLNAMFALHQSCSHV